MKLKTKLRSVTIIYFCFTVLFGVMIFLTLDSINENSRKNRLANGIIRDVFDLSSLMSDYLMKPQERTVSQWRIKQKELAGKITEGQMFFKKQENRDIFSIIKEDAADMAAAFDDLLAYDRQVAEGTPGRWSEKFKTYLVRRLLSDSHRMISNGYKLEHLKYRDILLMQRENQEILFGLMVVLFLITAVALFLIFRSIEMPVRILQRGARIVGGGDLDYRTEISSRDELGEVSRAFDEMTARLKKSRDEALLNELRTEALLKLNQMGDASLQEITDFALEEAVRLTKSKIGYLAFLNEDETVLTMHSWSKSAMQECSIIDKPIHYPVVTTGLWGEAVRQRKPVITNDYLAPNPLKKGCPEGHVNVLRHMNTPIFDEGKIVIVSGVGNKEEPYDASDIRQLTLLMQGMWRLLQRKKSAEALRHEKEFAKALLENMLDGVIACDAQGKLILFNRAARDWHGLEPEEMPQEEWASHYNLYSADGTSPMTIETVPLSRALRGEVVRNALFAIKAKNKPLRFTIANAAPFFDGQGHKLGAVAVMRDITDERRIQEALRQSEKNFRSLAENANDGIFVVVQDHTIGYLNQRAAELTAPQIGETGHVSLADYFSEEDYAKIRGQLTLILEGAADPFYFQSNLIKKDGAKVPVELTATSTVWKGAPAVILMVRDITERKKIEEFKNEMLRNVSHELRTPLHSMREGVSVVLEGLVGDISDEQRNVLMTTQANLDRLARLVNTFLDFQRLEAGLLKFDRRLQNLNELVLEAVSTLRPSAQCKQLQIETVLAGNLRAVEADGDRMLQVLLNLIGNAIKFTAKGVITVSTFMKENQVCVSVKDTGIGMRAEEFPKLFKQFSQLESGKQFSSTGTGLGLAISRSIIDLHGGKIWMESEFGSGSTFFFSLPAAAPV